MYLWTYLGREKLVDLKMLNVYIALSYSAYDFREARLLLIEKYGQLEALHVPGEIPVQHSSQYIDFAIIRRISEIKP